MILPMAFICVLGIIFCAGYTKSNGRITLLGTAVDQPFVANSSQIKAEQQSEWQTLRMRVTAYCPCPKCCGKYSDGITACGYRIRPDDALVAADRKYPFGTEMIIAGYKNERAVKVLDRGSAICGDRLDVFFDSHEEALKWGVRYLDVKVRLR